MSSLPGRLRRLVAAQVALGLGSVAVAATRIDDHPTPAVWIVLLAVALLAGGDLPLVHVRFGKDRSSFTCSEAAMVAGMVLLPAPWLPIVAASGALLLHGSMRRAPIKVVYNAASFATGGMLVWATYALLAPGYGRPEVGDVRGWIALTAGGLVAAAWTALTVTLAVAFSQGLRVGQVFREAYGIRILVSLANIAASILMAYSVRRYPSTALLVPGIGAVVLLTYRSYMRALQDRDSWQAVQAAARAFTTIDEAEVATTVVERAMSLFRADHVELLIADGTGNVPVIAVYATRDGLERVVASADNPFWPRAWSEREPFQVIARSAATPQRAALEESGLSACSVAPLIAGQMCIGLLRLGFARPMRLSHRELQLLTTYGDVVSAALRNAQLYADVSSERSKLSGIVDSASDGIFSVDGDGVVTSWNPAMVRITGIAAQAALGTVARLPRAGSPDLVVDGAWVRSVLDGEPHGETSIAVTASDGNRSWLSMSLSAVVSATDETPPTVVVVRDVTAAREADQAKQDFLATVSHELRTPITSLKGWVLTLLRPEYQPNAEERDDVHRRLLHHTDRLQRLIEDLLSVSSLEAGAFEIAANPVSVDEIVEKTVADFRLQPGSRPIEHIPAAGGSLAIGDAGRIEQVLSNLVSNADKYSGPGLPVTVTVRREGDQMIVRVRDHGPGIPTEHHEKVFERFTRLGALATREVGGTGLGLHIAQRLVQAMGGRIWVENAYGGGAEFVFTLPAAPAPHGVRQIRLVG
ncbi:MAG TPA: ATP-binding protein [Mycobacteriales bacterium]|nr:ATP-binding protein [Mycobacteriales bacterium]